MINSPGYTTMWNNTIITADYISGEVTSDSSFLYGSFECSAKYANQRGSWPAFWAFGGEGIPCELGGSNACEIDFSEFWNETAKNWLGQCYTVIKLENNIHRYYPSICGT
jgi:beta-glucanase (GH16 family)